MQWENCKKKLANLLWKTCRPLNIEKESQLDWTVLKLHFARSESCFTVMTEAEPPVALLKKNVEETGWA